MLLLLQRVRNIVVPACDQLESALRLLGSETVNGRRAEDVDVRDCLGVDLEGE